MSGFSAEWLAQREPHDAAARATQTTASALLDLVSERRLEALAHRCRAAAADVYFALTCDGRTTCSPADAEDSDALELFNRHQRRDKGFGAALGPSAPQRATEVFAALGYRVTTATSDWRIAAHDAPFQRAARRLARRGARDRSAACGGAARVARAPPRARRRAPLGAALYPR